MITEQLSEKKLNSFIHRKCKLFTQWFIKLGTFTVYIYILLLVLVNKSTDPGAKKHALKRRKCYCI